MLRVRGYLSGLHLLRAPAESHVGVVVGGAVALLLPDLWDERGAAAVLPLPHPVVVYGFEQVVVFVQQQLGLLQSHQLQNGGRDAAGVKTTLEQHRVESPINEPLTPSVRTELS